MKFRKKPVIIEAEQYLRHGSEAERQAMWCNGKQCNEGIIISTLEGDMLCRFGDWIIKDISGEFYPCKPDIFKETYEEVK